MGTNPSINTATPAIGRRGFLLAAAATASTLAGAQDRDYRDGASPPRYPEPDVVALDPRFAKYKLGSSPIRRVYHDPDMYWAEGPAWHGPGRYLLWSDIPGNKQMRWIEDDGHVSVLRHPSQNSNGNTFDYQGRQISCQHLTRRVVRYEYDGTETVLAETFDGKSLNAPNDAVVHPNGDIWFTDPGYGGLMNFEGRRADTGSVQPYQKESIYRIDAKTTQLHKVSDEIAKPNGLCFSPDYKKLYVADTGASHYDDVEPLIKQWDVVDEKTLDNGRLFTTMELQLPRRTAMRGGADGIRADVDGNIWSSAGWGGDGYDGVHIFAPDGDIIGQIRLPEVCSNLCFGGPKRNRVFMTASSSIYAIYVETRGAHIA